MKKLKIMSLFIIMIMVFSIVYNINAQTPESFTLRRDGSVYNPVDHSTTVAYFWYKYAEGSNCVVLCTGQRDDTAYEGSTYTRNNTNWSKDVRAGVATLIKEGVGEGALKGVGYGSSTAPELYITQIAIWKYLEDKGVVSNERLNAAMQKLNGANYYTTVNSLVASAKESEKALKVKLH